MRVIWNLLKICAAAFLFYLLCMLIKEIFNFIVAYWVWLLLLAVISILAYWLYKERWRFKRQHSPAKTIAEMKGKESIPEITSAQEYQDFLNSYSLIRSFITKVVGVTYPNDDGTSRQDILAMCLNGEPVVFEWHTFRGAPACAVITDHGQIGYLCADLAADLDADYGDGEYIFEGHISDILGGEDGLNYGCCIMLSIYGPHVNRAAVDLDNFDGDELFPLAVDTVLEAQQASATMLQKKLHIGYTRASRIMDELEEKGIVGPFRGSKPREILITKEQYAKE